jgi:hypothetical protein
VHASNVTPPSRQQFVDEVKGIVLPSTMTVRSRLRTKSCSSPCVGKDAHAGLTT